MCLKTDDAEKGLMADHQRTCARLAIVPDEASHSPNDSYSKLGKDIYLSQLGAAFRVWPAWVPPRVR